MRSSKRRSSLTPYVTIITYMEGGRYAVRLAVPAKFAALVNSYPDFHCAIQLPGAFIER